MTLDESIRLTLDAVQAAGLEELGYGRNRATYALGPRYVLKVPVNEDGCWDNESEAGQWRRKDAGFPIARCRILANEYGLPLLVMERVNTKPYRLGLPRWTDYVDGCQVGFTRKGVLVAYDFSQYEPPY